VVTGTRLQNTFSAADLQLIFSEFNRDTGKGDEQYDSADPTGPDDGMDDQTRQFLESQPEFLKLPTALQEIVLNSPSATAAFAQFFAQGGTINGVAMSGAQYWDGNPPRIDINQSLLSSALAAQASGNADNAQYYSRQLAGLLAHEVGHFMTDHLDWDTSGNLNEYIIYRTRLESLAIFAGLQMTQEMGVMPPHGYASPLNQYDLYQQYLQNGDWNATMNTIDSWVRNFGWSGGADANGDGVVNQVDRYTSQYPGGG